MISPEVLRSLIVAMQPMLLAITLHEVAHAWVAERLGDPTARWLGRITLNPLKHLDPLGVAVFVFSMMQGFGIGWAKPVPVNPGHFRHPRRGMMWVALAGPAMNFLLALASFILLHQLLRAGLAGGALGRPVGLMLWWSVRLNLVLMVFNLIPIPPLDGGRIVDGLLPGPLSYHYGRIEPYGFFIVIALLFVGVLGIILRPMYSIASTLIVSLGGML
ncbi:MAG: site-2 protease family protein [Nitrospinota bacterium]